MCDYGNHEHRFYVSPVHWHTLWVWVILRRWSAWAPIANTAVRDCQKFEKHWTRVTQLDCNTSFLNQHLLILQQIYHLTLASILQVSASRTGMEHFFNWWVQVFYKNFHKGSRQRKALSLEEAFFYSFRIRKGHTWKLLSSGPFSEVALCRAFPMSLFPFPTLPIQFNDTQFDSLSPWRCKQ
jgi:hypothetical protein